MPIVIAPDLVIPDDELEWRFVRSSGPGGQNVNKVSSAAQLKFLLARSTRLAPGVKARLARLAGRRLTEDGDLLLKAMSERSQEQNRRAAEERLGALIRAALVEPKVRRKTRPTRASKERRIDSKKRRGVAKRQRGRADWE
ncbi:MAG TPA: alternative ribosome rescue aminoacyl-tRNA hydrolase ArfB [Steroidobacteraceae bacterium]|jgi:ribosome-associated protein|nr:alternative ribosome rescue aminoacyl-tRNA hydrolase ArfB [Steroidobacteraceae bacterium]